MLAFWLLKKWEIGFWLHAAVFLISKIQSMFEQQATSNKQRATR
jgi:hypothetical protein